MNTDGPCDKVVARLLYGPSGCLFRIVLSWYATDPGQFCFRLSEPYTCFFRTRDELLQLLATRFDKVQIAAFSTSVVQTTNDPRTSIAGFLYILKYHDLAQ